MLTMLRMIFLHLALFLLASVECQPKKRMTWGRQASWENECCKEKIVGGVRYLNIGYDPTGRTTNFQCLSPCLFEKEGEAGSKYCFAAGDLRVECKDDWVMRRHTELAGTVHANAPEILLEIEN